MMLTCNALCQKKKKPIYQELIEKVLFFSLTNSFIDCLINTLFQYQKKSVTMEANYGTLNSFKNSKTVELIKVTHNTHRANESAPATKTAFCSCVEKLCK